MRTFVALDLSIDQGASLMRFALFVHNVIAHPLMEIFTLCGFRRIGTLIHDKTLPGELRVRRAEESRALLPFPGSPLDQRSHIGDVLAHIDRDGTRLVITITLDFDGSVIYGDCGAASKVEKVGLLEMAKQLIAEE